MRFSYERHDGSRVDGVVRAGSFNLAMDNGQLVLTCDAMGRPWTIWRRNKTYRRSYSGRVLDVWRGNDGVRQRQWVAEEDFNDVWGRLRCDLRRDLEKPLKTQPDIADRVRRAVEMTPARLREDARKYGSLYEGGLGILPPDGYLDIVLQLARGCAYNQCTFCHFFKHRPFKTKTMAEFESHAEAVADFLGEALPMRKGVYLADGDALTVSDDHLLNALEMATQRFPKRAIASFAGPAMRRNRSIEVYQRARSLNLRRIHVGIESGSINVLKTLGKPTPASWWLAPVERIKAGGINLGLVVLVGAGGSRLEKGHVEHTLKLLDEMPIGKGDIVYLSELRPERGAPYYAQLEEIDSNHLDDVAMAAQTVRFRSALKAMGKGFRVARYDIRDYIG